MMRMPGHRSFWDVERAQMRPPRVVALPRVTPAFVLGDLGVLRSRIRRRSRLPGVGTMALVRGHWSESSWRCLGAGLEAKVGGAGLEPATSCL
jgi:hypothetical protein